MTLKLNGSSSGSTSIDAPASGSDRTITCPDATGTMALTTDFNNSVTEGSWTSVGTSTHIDVSTTSTDVIKYDILFSGVSTDGSNDWQFQLGDAGGLETSGYNVIAGYDGSNEGTDERDAGWRWKATGTASFIMDGKFTLTRMNGNKWWGEGVLIRTEGGTTLYYMYGSKELSAALTTIRIMASSNLSTDFDGGHFKLITYK
tara:strand:+ start:573 stop:1178 length:606 start_codon:yes stop_codon:yes gene_type:complete